MRIQRSEGLGSRLGLDNRGSNEDFGPMQNPAAELQTAIV